MGAESFLVKIEGSTLGSEATVDVLRELGFASVRLVTGHPELERRTADLVAEAAVRPWCVSFRFAVCHPEDAAGMFARIVTSAAQRLAGEVVVQEDVAGRDRFRASETNEIIEAITAGARPKRRMWIQQFGVHGVMSCHEAWHAALGGQARSP